MPSSAGPAAAPVVQPVDKEVVFWQSIQSSSNASDYQAYLDQYPNGTFAALARTRIDALKTKPAEASRSSDQVAALTAPDSTVPAAEEVERSIGLTKQGDHFWLSLRPAFIIRRHWRGSASSHRSPPGRPIAPRLRPAI
jgi:hypothetical protein